MTDLLLMLLIGASPGVAASSASAPIDATLTVRLRAGKSTYAMGELIPLDLEFRGQAGPDYSFSTGMHDRSGRMGIEEYAITPPEGSDDPLAEYFSTVGSVGGGLSSWHPLDGTPLFVRVCLNDWVRFTRPGDYRLVVTSSRLQWGSRRQAAPVLVSSPIALHVEPASPEWAAAEAAQAVSALGSRDPDTLRKGVAVLRHLGTRQAGLALVSRYGAGGEALRFAVTAGLVASPHRADIVTAMEARLDAGEPLPAGFVRDLTILRSLLDLSAGRTQLRDLFDSQTARGCEYTRRWVEAIARRGSSAEILGAVLAALREPPDPTCEGAVAPLLARDPEAARAAFLALPERTQGLLLEHRWSAIGGSWIQPALEELYAKWAGDSRVEGAGDSALRRLVEMDPAKGRALVLEEIRTGAHGLAPDTLLSLGEGPLPGLDDALRARHRAARSDDRRAAALWLIARYGSSGLAPLVRAELERPSPCDAEAAALAYLLKHDPPAAFARLQPGFDRHRPGMCVLPPWRQLVPRYWDERVEDALIAQLGDREPRLVVDAAQILQSHGSAGTKVPLLERLARWGAAWRGRGEELDTGWPSAPAAPSSPDSPATVENALVNALFDNPRITLRAEDVRRIRGLCVTTLCRNDVDARVRSRRAPAITPEERD